MEEFPVVTTWTRPRKRSVLPPQLAEVPPAEMEERLSRALRSGEALPPLDGQPSSAQFSLFGWDSKRPEDHPEIATLAWRQYQRHGFGEHSEHCAEDRCPKYRTAIVVLSRLWVLPPHNASVEPPVWVKPTDTELSDVA